MMLDTFQAESLRDPEGTMSSDIPDAIPASTSPHTSYALGSTDRERQRLVVQGAVFRGFTESLLRSAGVYSGMQVLDIGSGVGDVALLAADFVGAQGSVLGIDRDAQSVAWATKRVEESGRSNIHFVTAELSDFDYPSSFDALVGRFILMYLPDPVQTLRILSRHLRQGASHGRTWLRSRSIRTK